MKCHARVMLILVITLIGAAPATADDPAEVLCDRGGGASTSDRVANLTFFWGAIDPYPGSVSDLGVSDAACVSDRLKGISAEIGAYCDARAAKGHDLQIRELRALETKLSSLAFECHQLRFEAEQAKYDKLIPESCDELIASFQTLADLMDEPPYPKPDQAECVRANIARVAPPVVSLCAAQTLSVRSSWHEISSRIGTRCSSAEVD